jgi:hypothetical protein
MRLLRWFTDWWEGMRREANIPAPPFRASKRTAVIMYGLWYGRLTLTEAREKAVRWGFSPESIDDMILQATQPPSYWSRPSLQRASDAELDNGLESQ